MSTPAETYNYSAFRPEPYVESGCDGPEKGESLARYVVRGLDGRQHRVGDLVRGTTVLETGSTTCPLYVAQIDPMKSVAASHPDVEFAVLYTREAHPGERRGPHVNIEDKIGAAGRLANDAGEWRTVWVDALDGDLHNALSAAPNSVVVLDEEATVLIWLHDSDARALNDFLASLASGNPASVQGRFRPPPPHAIRALSRGGWKAVGDFLLGLPQLIRYRLTGGASC